jgi:hypothetical protein
MVEQPSEMLEKQAAELLSPYDGYSSPESIEALGS